MVKCWERCAPAAYNISWSLNDLFVGNLQDDIFDLFCSRNSVLVKTFYPFIFLTLTSDKNLSKTYVDTLLLAFKNASTFLLPTDLSFPLPLLADGVRIKVSSVSKLVLVLNFSLEFSLFAKLCEYVCIRLLPCWNSFTENVVDWNACVKTLACMLKWSMWCSWISGWFFKKSMKMIGASEFSDGKYLKVCVLF